MLELLISGNSKINNMAVDITIDISEETGTFARIFSSGGYNLSDVFTGTPQFYPGSIVQIQEILTIDTILDDESLISTDLRWFETKRRLGTYQVGDILITSPYSDEDEGFIQYLSQSIKRYSFYTITAAPDVPFGKHEQISLDNCNAYLTPEVYVFPGDPTPDAGFRYYPLNPIFLGSNTISKAPLRDTDFNQKMKGVGIHLNAGVRGSSLRYQVAVINDIYTNYEPVTPPTCEFLGASCDAQFAAFILEEPNSRFLDIDTCVTTSTVGCIPNTYVCATDPTFVRTYYIPTPN